MIAKTIGRLAFAAVLAAAISAGSAPARAQEPSAGAVAMAREIIVLKGGNVLFERIVPGVIENVKNNFLPTNPQLGKPLNEVAEILHKEFEPKRAEIVTEAARIFAQRFTEQELKDIVAFYRTPTGKKLAVEEPISIDQSMRRAQTWADDLLEKVMTRFRAEMKKKGYNL
jgi:uncharacterized protein